MSRTPSASGSSREMQVLMVLARPDLAPDAVSRVASRLADGVDWRSLLTLAERHRVLPLIARHLRTLGAVVPAPVEASFRDHERANTIAVLQRTGQLLEVLSELRQRGILGVPYKGPALGAQLYGSGDLRHAGDLDVVVRPCHVVESRRALTSLGYRSRFAIGEEAVPFMLRHRYDEEFVRGDGGHVELHWGFTNREFPFALDLEIPFGRLRAVELAGHEVPALHPEDLLLILSVHGAKHRWERLEWLVGVAQVLREAEAIDWSALGRRAASLGVRRTLWLALLLASDLLEAPVPPPVLAEGRRDRQASALQQQVVELLRQEPVGWAVPDRLDRDRFRIRLRERWRDRARFVWHRSTTPSDPERWEVSRIGRWHVPVHAFRRPFHVAAQLVVALRTLIPAS